MNDPITRRKSLITLGGVVGSVLAGGALRAASAGGATASGPARRALARAFRSAGYDAVLKALARKMAATGFVLKEPQLIG